VRPILDGGLVRAELDRLGLTQAEFADRFHLREATVSNAVRGHPLSAEIVYRILLGLELAEANK
jgi:plasmid maintenance system antidote protein VapI